MVVSDNLKGKTMRTFFNELKAYKKSITAIVGALISWAQLVVFSSSEAITAPEWIALAVGLATAFGVYQLANEPQR